MFRDFGRISKKSILIAYLQAIFRNYLSTKCQQNAFLEYCL